MRPHTKSLIYFLVAAAMFVGAGLCVSRINQQRKADQLVAAELPEAAQPGLMLGPLLAIGRAPAVDYLWLRATKLKDEGRYFDAYQLAEAIGRLEPRFAAAWAFNAWNMAYNISVTLRSPEERWRWVRNGIELLRDQGIPKNPRNTQMYKELAWIFFHKIGDFLDDAHWYYKNQLALMMEDILGPGPTHDYAAMAAMPPTWEELAASPDVKAVVRVFATLGEHIDKPGVFLGLLGRDNLSRDLTAALSDAKARAVRRRIELFWRTRRLRDEVKLDPARIVRLCEAYGPIDFRLGEAHALYWASLGVEIGADPRVAVDVDRLNTDRIELYCLQNFYRRGRLVLSPSAREGEPPLLLPDVRFADTLRRAFLAVSKRYAKPGRDEGPVVMNFQSAFINFMRDAVVRFNEAGQLAKSREYYDFLVKHYPDDAYKEGYEAFLLKEWREDQQVPMFQVVDHRLVTLIAQGVQLIAYGEYEQGQAAIAYADRLWHDYEKQVVAKSRHLRPFRSLYEYIVHEMGSRMRPESYQRVLKYTGFRRPTTTATAPVNR